VVATFAAARPNTIVISATSWKGQEIIIGAAVEADTVITRGNRRVSPEAIKPGDVVDIVYVRNKRVLAKTIKAI
jgi:hypothetical protein